MQLFFSWNRVFFLLGKGLSIPDTLDHPNFWWHWLNKMLLRNDSDMMASYACCRFVGWTLMMRISHSTTMQRCSAGLRSGNFVVRFSIVNSLCSRNHFEKMATFWSIKEFMRHSTGPKVCQQNIPHTIKLPAPAWTINTRIDPCFYRYTVYSKFWHYQSNVAADIKWFSTFLLIYSTLCDKT